MRIGYARVSTKEQDTQLQIDALKKAGCEVIYEEKVSGSKLDRLELENCLKSLRKGDELMVWKLDRLGRSLSQLINIIEEIREKGVEFSVITENIDTSTPSGKMMFHIFATIAEYERSMVKERVCAGLDVARKNGRYGGRPNALSGSDKKMAIAMLKGGATKSEISKHFNVCRQTIYRFFKEKNQIS